MTLDPTSLHATYTAGKQSALLAWTAPTSTYDTIRVSMRVHGTTPWIPQYVGGVGTIQRRLWPVPGIAYDFLVEGGAAGVFGTSPAELDNQVVDWGSDAWTVRLLNTATLAEIHLGTVKDYTSLKKVYRSKVQSFTAMGMRYPKDWPSRANFRAYPQAVFAIFNDDVRDDGTVIDNAVVTIPALEATFPPAMPLLQWADWSGYVTYVKVMPDPDITPVEGDGWEANLNLEERQPPAFPPTAAT